MHRRMARWTAAGALALGLGTGTVFGATEGAKAEAPKANPKDEAKPAPGAKPKVDVVFVIDTTGSMGGLIEGAKQKVWSIVKEMCKAKPVPEIRVGFVAYRDRGDDYVTKVFDLTDDLDGMYKNLQGFQAAGGGDTPEHVNRALKDAVNAFAWSKEEGALKVIFLVGDAPPHTDYGPDATEQDVPDYRKVCEAAVRKGIVINTVRCGNDSETEKVWQEIARRSEGRYASIEQSGGVVAISTPMDKEIAELSGKVAGSVVAYGEARARRAIAGRAKAAREMADAAPAEAVADRAEVLAKSAPAAPAAAPALAMGAAGGAAMRETEGGGDLLAAVESKSVELDKLKDDQLPEEMRKMTPDERKAYVAKKQADRKAAEERLKKLIEERGKFLEAEKAKAGPTGFDAEVLKALKEQAKKKGLEFE